MSDWRLTTENTALVVIDVQEKLMNVMPRRAETLAAIQKLIGAARVLKLPTLVTAQYIKGLGPVCAEIGRAAPGITPLEKMTFSCCGSEEFLRTVKDLRRQRIILCGIEAHVCVQQTAIDLMKDYFVYVAADAISSRHETDYTVAIERMRDCGAVITTVESAVFELLRESGTQEFKQILPLFK
ncbi:MAG TPA: hydrolase [Verrucomicrobiae bacterium]|nr:hydrolase [Verrucomicrobiae bacterium]